MFIHDQNGGGEPDNDIDVGGADDVLDIDVDVDIEPSDTKLEAKEPKVPDNIADKKPSIRDAIKHGFKKEEEKDLSLKPNAKDGNVGKKPSTIQSKDDEASDDQTTKDVSAPKTTEIKPPPGWTKEAKAVWEQLPDAVKLSVAKREKEVSDGFKKYGEDSTRLRDLDSVLTPRREAIKQFGVSEAQTVDRLFQWMEALNHPDKNYAMQQWMALGQSFGLQLPSTQTQKPPSQQAQPQENISDDELPAPLKNFMDTVVNKVQGVEQTLQQQRDQAALAFVENWSRDKPHFNAVRPHMFAILQSGVIPLKNGQLDLDEAYNQAVYANPTVRELVVKEQEEKANQEAEAARQRAEHARLAKLEKARKAGSSLSSRAPSGSPINKTGTNKTPSVADSIRAAMREVNGT